MTNIELIKSEINRYGADEIILFGSRATNKADKYSDYDLLVIFNSDLSHENKMTIATKIRCNMAIKFIDADVLVRTKKDVEQGRNQIGSVIKSAIREGIVL